MGWSGEPGYSLMSRDTSYLFPELRSNEGNNQKVSHRVSELPVRHDRPYIILYSYMRTNVRCSIEITTNWFIEHIYFGFCVVLRIFCIRKTCHCDVTVGLFCDVTPHNLWRQTIVTSTARAKRCPTCEIWILFTGIFPAYCIRKCHNYVANGTYHHQCHIIEHDLKEVNKKQSLPKCHDPKLISWRGARIKTWRN